MSKKSNLAAFAALAMMGDTMASTGQDVRPEDLSGTPPDRKPPAGTMEWYFGSNGYCHTNKDKVQGYVFKCFASNKKNAIRKFNNWKIQNSPTNE